MKVVVVSKHNYAGSAYYTMKALRGAGHEARLITLQRNASKFELPQDIVLSEEIEHRRVVEVDKRAMGVMERIQNNKLRAAMHRNGLRDLQKILDEADIIHFKGDDLPSVDYISPLKISRNKPWLFEAGGSSFRRKGIVDKIAHPLASLDEYARRADKLCAVTADLCYGDIDWLPHAFDVKGCEPVWQEPAGKPVIMAIPSHPLKKGIPQYFLPALDILRERGYDFELVMPDGQISQAESIALKKRATIYFDQVAIGWYSRSAVEAMSLGIPVIFWLSEEAKEQNNLWGGLSVNDKKLLSLYDEQVPTAEGLADAFERLLNRPKGFPHLATLSRWARKYAEKLHDNDKVAVRLLGYYEEALSEKKND